MIIKASLGVINAGQIEQDLDIHLEPGVPISELEMVDPGAAIAYTPLINAHDHLIGNWFPRAGDKRPYHNSHIWVEDMKSSFSFHERNKFWMNDGRFQLEEPASMVLAKLGAYKNLFSGCGIVHDHAPVQVDQYYEAMPIQVVKDYRQCHSITLENWWGGESAEEEMKLTGGRIPYIIHLGEGIDAITKAEFSELVSRNLLQRNTMMIHGIAFTPEDYVKIAAARASVCWCPTSNWYLIGKTLDYKAALAAGANLCIGTDSTMSGGVNLIAEFTKVHEEYPELPLSLLYKMATENAVWALMLPNEYAQLNPSGARNLLLMDLLDRDPFVNLLDCDASHIKLLMLDGRPLYGDSSWLEVFELPEDQYSTFRSSGREKFVLGDPQDLNDQIDTVLGYHKDFPYLPF